MIEDFLKNMIKIPNQNVSERIGTIVLEVYKALIRILG